MQDLVCEIHVRPTTTYYSAIFEDSDLVTLEVRFTKCEYYKEGSKTDINYEEHVKCKLSNAILL